MSPRRTGAKLTGSAEARGDKWVVEADGREVVLSNLDRVLYPETGFTKGDLIDYYAAVAPVLIPHLAGRPLSMRRFPGGVEEGGFWEKRCPAHRPGWVETAAIWSESKGEEIDYCLVNDMATLVWAANLADIELHTSLATAEGRSTPTVMVFDLDPGAPAGIVECADLALLIRETLTGQGLESLVKVSGSKGMQLYVPLNPGASYEQTAPFARALARAFEEEMPDRVVSKMKKSLRPGKVLIDWSQNSEHKTTVCAYSMRARSRPGVSVPVSWEEVERAVDGESEGDLVFEPGDALRRVGELGDLFRGVLELEQALPE